MAGIDLDLVRHALSVARKSGYAEVELNSGDLSFIARLEPRKARPKSKSAAMEPSSTDPSVGFVKAPLVGYYREAAKPLKIGETVSRGEVVAVIAALGLANDVESPVSGEIVEVFVQPDQPVEFGQVLATVRQTP